MDHIGNSAPAIFATTTESSLMELISISGSGYEFLMTHLWLIVTAAILIMITYVYMLIMRPMNYELDMTQKDYCKSIAEIDNTLRFQRGSLGELQYSRNHAQNSLNCATDTLPAPDSRPPNCVDSGGENSQTGSVNHVYPNGWIPVLESHKVKAGKIKKTIAFGRDLIVTRSFDGKQVSVMDAYCPHMGAHLGVGGMMKEVNNESSVECPFHLWRFRASDGQCVEIPTPTGSSKCAIPKQAKLATWTCAEVDNFIYVWHHIGGQPPSWFLEASPELSQPDWFLAGRSYHKSNLDFRDMLQNGADQSHFEGIHSDHFIWGGDINKLGPLKHLQNITRHHWQPEWRPVLDKDGKRTHMAQMRVKSYVKLLNLKIVHMDHTATQIGPARVTLSYDCGWYGKGLITMNAIPLGGRRTKYFQHIYTERTLFHSMMAKFFLRAEINMLERDLMIWNHKKDIRNPIFVPEDKFTIQFRLWYSQFYQRKRQITIQ